MSKIKIISITLLALLLNSCGFLGTCDDEPIDQPFTDPYKAVVLERTEFENSIQVQPEQPIIKSGKIYIKDDLMFINRFSS